MADEMIYFAEILFRGVCVLVLMQTTTLASTMFFGNWDTQLSKVVDSPHKRILFYQWLRSTCRQTKHFSEILFRGVRVSALTPTATLASAGTRAVPPTRAARTPTAARSHGPPWRSPG